MNEQQVIDLIRIINLIGEGGERVVSVSHKEGKSGYDVLILTESGSVIPFVENETPKAAEKISRGAFKEIKRRKMLTPLDELQEFNGPTVRSEYSALDKTELSRVLATRAKGAGIGSSALLNSWLFQVSRRAQSSLTEAAETISTYAKKGLKATFQRYVINTYKGALKKRGLDTFQMLKTLQNPSQMLSALESSDDSEAVKNVNSILKFTMPQLAKLLGVDQEALLAGTVENFLNVNNEDSVMSFIQNLNNKAHEFTRKDFIDSIASVAGIASMACESNLTTSLMPLSMQKTFNEITLLYSTLEAQGRQGVLSQSNNEHIDQLATRLISQLSRSQTIKDLDAWYEREGEKILRTPVKCSHFNNHVRITDEQTLRNLSKPAPVKPEQEQHSAPLHKR